jgi:hypothetical protein
VGTTTAPSFAPSLPEKLVKFRDSWMLLECGINVNVVYQDQKDKQNAFELV